MGDSTPIWSQPAIIEWSQLLMNSYRHWVGRDLMKREGKPEDQAQSLFLAPFVVVIGTIRETITRCSVWRGTRRLKLSTSSIGNSMERANCG